MNCNASILASSEYLPLANVDRAKFNNREQTIWFSTERNHSERRLAQNWKEISGREEENTYFYNSFKGLIKWEQSQNGGWKYNTKNGNLWPEFKE